MVTKTEHSPTGLLRWVASFAAAMALIDLWTGDYSGAAFQTALALLLFVEASESRPAGWLRASFIVLMASLLAFRVMRWTGFLG